MSAPRTSFIALVCALGTAPVFAQATAAPQQPAAKSAAKSAAQPALPEGVPTPADYVIGADDQLSIVFWRDKDMTSDVGVRPDGKISLPLINEVMAAGLTPEQLRVKITEASSKFIEDPEVSVVVKQINSRRIYVTGQVGRPGPYPLSGPTTVLQMLATAGGVGEYSKSDRIVVMRTENGKTVSHKFNYKDVSQGKKLEQNIELKPGDTIIVP